MSYVKITVLGSTGSIGVSTLDVVRQNRDQFKIHSLVAGRNLDVLCSQILEFRPELVVVADETILQALRLRLRELAVAAVDLPQLAAGPAARVLAATAGEVGFVMSAIVGVAGLEATYAAIKARKRIGLANKEVLVASGALVMEAVRQSGAELIPVDSEHNGAHQCFRAGTPEEVTRLLLTASGGPFRDTPRDALWNVTPEQALNHPTWKMGRRITIDSATLMNKGFEVIEACWLFGFEPSQVTVVIHPQSTVHAMIEYSDGSVIAQISATDMRMPIQYALTYPERREAPVPKIDWAKARQWEFLPPDFEKFPLLRLAYQCQEAGGAATCVLNAADEVAVEAFLAGRIGYQSIYDIVRETLDRIPACTPRSVAEILEIDRDARKEALGLVEARTAAAV